MSRKKIGEGEDQMIDPRYRRFTEDEIKELKRGISNWSDRMNEESNFLYKLKCSLGAITPSFIEAVIESLKASGDFEITSLGHTKFILFIGGNQPQLRKDVDRTIPNNPSIDNQLKNALKRLEYNHFQVLNSEGYSYRVSKLGKQWVLSESQQNTIPVTLKPRLDIALLYELLSSEGIVLNPSPRRERIRQATLKESRVIE